MFSNYLYYKIDLDMAVTLTKDMEDLFRRVRSELGAPIVSVELNNDILCDLFKNTVDDYSEKVQNWLTEVQWATLYGKNVTNLDMTYALSLRTLDMSKDFANWFSKEVGLQQEGPWELKKDFITIEKGKQVYMVPSGRTINKVMYVSPPPTYAALFANYGGLDFGVGGGLGQLGVGAYGGMYGPMGGFYTAPAADVAYLATDLQYKKRLLHSDLVYKVTAGPNGTHLIHLLSTPGSRLNFGYAGPQGNDLGLVGCTVWYTYYDTSAGGEDECLRANAGNVIITPDQVPLSSMDYSMFNSPTKSIIRQLLIAKAKKTLGLIRGKYSGKVNIPQAEMQMDYQMLIQQGEKEWEAAMKDLTERLGRMRPSAYLEEQAKLIDNMKKIQESTPLTWLVI
jgi:hypothetical protein